MGALLVKNSRGAEVVALKQGLRNLLGAEADHYPGLDKGELFDADTESAVRCWQSGIGIIADGVVGPHCLALLGLRKPNALAIELSTGAVQTLFPATKPSNIVRYLPYVAAALDVAGLTDQPMICAALGTIRAESEGFLPIAEYPSQYNTLPGQAAFSAYDGRKSLGNIEPGDGARFRGRGFVQLTGRDNYTRYGPQLGIDLAANADLANAPEVASLLLAYFLANCADRMRIALNKGDLAAARKLVNGGSHGLDRFKDVFRLAEKIWPSGTAGRSKVGKTTRAAAHAASKTRRTATKKDPADLRDRPYQPPPLSLPDEYPPNPEVAHHFAAYTKAGLILDQGQEGACTGFGLACVVNYLRWRKHGLPARLESVSPRMLYNFARRYDEYEGEGYDGSSCRGALKGWFHHGVCLETDWPYHSSNLAPPRYGYAKRAADNTLGVYYRIDTKCITDMQAAILQVGAIYVSSYTHDGWDNLPAAGKKPLSHSTLPLIPYDGKPSRDGGHAFALVGFNRHGFVIQNSWGNGWAAGGFAIIGYADWLANGMDAWVAALGVPSVVPGRLAEGTATESGTAGARHDAWWSEAKAYEHSLVFGNDGRINRYVTQDELSRTLLYQACGLPDQWFRNNPSKKKRLLIYAHGGLNSEDDAIERARAMGRFFTGNDCYPLFLVWKTGLCESIGDIIKDSFRKAPGIAGAGFSEVTDLMIEKTIGRPLARPIWSEMKENAELCCGAGRGGDLLVTALQKLAATWGEALEIHLVGHSAGSIILGHLLSLATTRGLQERIASIHLYAPACTVQFATRHYAPQTALMERLYLDVLSEQNERDDNVVAIYRKSLLYLVSNALESDLRTPILGMENVFKPDYTGWDGSSTTGEVLGNWRQAAKAAGLDKRMTLLDAPKVTVRLPDKQIKAGHGSFDNDVTTVGRTLERILGGKLKLAVDDLRGF